MCHTKNLIPTRLYRMLPRVCFWTVCSGADQEGNLDTGWGVNLEWVACPNSLVVSTEGNMPTLHLDFPKCSIREGKNVSISQTSNEMPLFSRCLQYNWWETQRRERLQWLGGEKSTCNAGDLGLILGQKGSLGVGSGNLFHYSHLKIPMDRGAQWVTVQRVANSQTRLSMSILKR